MGQHRRPLRRKCATQTGSNTTGDPTDMLGAHLEEAGSSRAVHGRPGLGSSWLVLLAIGRRHGRKSLPVESRFEAGCANRVRSAFFLGGIATRSQARTFATSRGPGRSSSPGELRLTWTAVKPSYTAARCLGRSRTWQTARCGSAASEQLNRRAHGFGKSVQVTVLVRKPRQLTRGTGRGF